MKRDDLLNDDAALHESLASLGAPPAAAPKATAAAILASAATGVTASAVAGMAIWKVVLLVTAGSLLGVAGGFGLRGAFQGPAQEAEAVVTAWNEEQIAQVCADVVAQERQARAPSVEPVEFAASEPGDAAATVANGGSPRRHRLQEAVPSPPGHGPVSQPVLLDDEPLAARETQTLVPEGCPEVPGQRQPDDDLWIPDPEPYERSSREPRTPPEEPARLSGGDGAGGWTATADPRAGHTGLRVGAGAVTSLGLWESLAPPVGPQLTLQLVRLGPTQGFSRPVALLGLEGALLVGSQHTPSRFVGGLQLGGGIALDGGRSRLELAWTLAGHGMPPADVRSGKLWLTTGPQLGFTATPRPGGAAFHVAASIHASAMRLEDDEIEIAPWLWLSAGVELPLAPRP